MPLCRKLCLVPTKNLKKSHKNLIYISTANVKSRLNSIYKNNMKNISKLVIAAYCSFFSDISGVILLLGACSEQFPTAEYNKSKKWNIKLRIHDFYSTKSYLHFHIPTSHKKFTKFRTISFNKTFLINFIWSKAAGFRPAVYCKWTPAHAFCKGSVKVLLIYWGLENQLLYRTPLHNGWLRFRFYKYLNKPPMKAFSFIKITCLPCSALMKKEFFWSNLHFKHRFNMK